MNKEKLINIIIFIIFIALLMGESYIIVYMQPQAQASYSALEAMTPQAIERKRVRGILNE